MNNSVTLFLEGDLTEKGFHIKKQNHNQNCDFLPPCKKLIITYNNWREELYKFEQYSITINTDYSEATSNDNNSPLDDFNEMIEEENNEYEQKKQEYNDSEQSLIIQINEWLNKLKELLGKLHKYKITAIGLDIYRDFHATSELKTELQKDYVFGVCKKPFLSEPGIKPSPEINNIGFVDAIEDNDKTIRRHILTSSRENIDCPVSANLSFLLGLYYLYQQEPKLYELYEKEQNEIKQNKKNPCIFRLGKAEFKALNFISKTTNNPLSKLFQNNQGSYQNEDLKACQIMLNYRMVNSSIKNVAETVTLSQILNDEIFEEKIKDRIILVGIVDSPSESNDYWKTPYSREEIAGVFIQAQMLSQILSAALDGRSLISPLLFWQDLIVIFACSFISTLTTYLLTDRLGKPKTFLIICCLDFLICVISFCLLLKPGIWLPLIPSGLVIIIAPILIWIGEIDVNRLEKRLNYQFN